MDQEKQVLLLLLLLLLLLHLSMPTPSWNMCKSDIVPLILITGYREKCLVRITSQTLCQIESSPLPIIHEAVWAPGPGWIL